MSDYIGLNTYRIDYNMHVGMLFSPVKYYFCGKLLKMRKVIITLLGLLMGATLWSMEPKKIVAYVTSWSEVMPDPHAMTHINYAFGHVNDSLDGIRIDNPGRLRSIVALKQQNPRLKVLISVGGWGSGRFSEMVSDEARRHAFAADALHKVEEFRLDGIDIDWEYPGSSSAGISSAPTDRANFTLLMKDLRKYLGNGRLVTLATAAGGEFYDFPAFIDDVDFVNIMSYDMGQAPQHHAPLFNSARFTGMSCEKAVNAHIAQGVPPSKLTLGLPFYGRGAGMVGNFVNFREIAPEEGLHAAIDTVAAVPYLADSEGKVILGYDDARSLTIKSRWALGKGLAGVMYWDYAGDDDKATLSQAVRRAVPTSWFPRFHALVIFNPHVEPAHRKFAEDAVAFFKEMSVGDGMVFTYTSDFNDLEYNYLKSFDLVISLDDNPGHTPAQRQAFERYMENGGSWLGFHGAAFNNESTHWPWFVDFLGGAVFHRNNWPPLPAKIIVDSTMTPVTKAMPASYTAPANEWYQWEPSPRRCKDVTVYASLSKDNYPLGFKDEIPGGDTPVVWGNRRYNMVYMNFGHGPGQFSEATQCMLICNAIRWLMRNEYGSVSAETVG